jgi:hypothetical protein
VRDQNRALDMMGGGFGDTDNLINSTMKKMQVWAAARAVPPPARPRASPRTLAVRGPFSPAS